MDTEYIWAMVHSTNKHVVQLVIRKIGSFITFLSVYRIGTYNKGLIYIQVTLPLNRNLLFFNFFFAENLFRFWITRCYGGQIKFKSISNSFTKNANWRSNLCFNNVSSRRRNWVNLFFWNFFFFVQISNFFFFLKFCRWWNRRWWKTKIKSKYCWVIWRRCKCGYQYK